MAAEMSSELLFDADGNPEHRFLAVDVITVPNDILLSNDRKHLGVKDDEAYWHGNGQQRRVSSDVLSRFIQLSEHPPVRIAQFARRWGLLGLCEHDQPATHRLEDRDGRERPMLLPYRGCTPQATESIQSWRMYSQRFRNMIEVAQRLHRCEFIGDEVWDTIGIPRRTYFAGRVSPLRVQRIRFARAVNLQLAASAIQPIVQWGHGEPIIRFGVFGAVRTTLFAALAMQLASAVSDCKIATCSGCHKVYRPNRRTHAQQANYCPECREAGVDVRVRVQRLRDRRRAAI